MLTRRQHKARTVAAVVECRDLLALILPSVRGAAPRKLVAFEVLPCVCRAWAAVWAEVGPRHTTTTVCRGISVYVSACEYVALAGAARDFHAAYTRATGLLRASALVALRCTHDNVPSLLGLAVVEMALRFDTALRERPAVSPRLWEYVECLRVWLAKCVRVCRCKSTACTPAVPLVPTDPVHAALARA